MPYEFRRPRKPKMRISAFALAVLVTTAAVIVTSTCVATITSIFSENAAVNMAQKFTNVMMEKTTLRIKGVLDRANGVAKGAQSGILISNNSPMPHEDWAGREWYVKWRMRAVMLDKSVTEGAHAISFLFDDGSYVTSGDYVVDNERNWICAAHLGNNTPPSAPSEPVRWTVAEMAYHNYTNMKLLRTATVAMPMEAQRMEGYNKSMPLFAQTYSSVMSLGGTVPTIKLSYSIFNASYIFLGIGEVQLTLGIFSSLVESQRPTPNTHVLILGRYRNVIASSIRNTPTSSNVTVPMGHVLTDEERLNGCVVTSSMNTTYDRQFLICLKNAQSFGYAPLQVMSRMGLIPSKDETDIFRDVTRVKLDSLGHYYLAIVDYNPYFPTLDWIAIVLIPEKEVLKDIIYGRSIAIGVCVVLAVVVAIGNGFLMRLFLRPLAEIAYGMQSASYLEESSASASHQKRTADNSLSATPCAPPATSEEISSHANSAREERLKRKRLTKAAEAARQLQTNRRPSYLSDVAAIQNAYWGMVDELSILRSYIPEQIRDRLLDTHKRRCSTALPPQRQRSISSHHETEKANGDSGSVCEMHEFDGFGSGVDMSRVDEWAKEQMAVSIEALPSEGLNEWKASTSSGRNASSGAEATNNTNGTIIYSEVQRASVEVPEIFAIGDVRTHESGDQVASSNEEVSTHVPRPIENGKAGPMAPPFISEVASTRQAAKFASLGNISEMNDARTFKSSEPLPLFTENGLVERNITVALINLTGFHNYVFSTPTSKVIKEHEYFVNYLHEVAKRCGGVLDNFNGDKFWVSFNASAPCDEIYVAATLFAYEVASTVNREAMTHSHYLNCERQRPLGIPPLSPQRPRFHVALRGVTIGVATGRAFVGPLGTKNIRRLTITSNALSEAAALERMAARYPDCGVMVGGDMIPAIEGYFQYMLLDATALPGSGGLRRRIASVKGLLQNPKVSRLVGKLTSPPSANPFDAINECFNAFLEGRAMEISQMVVNIANYVSISRHAHQLKQIASLPDGRPLLTPHECNNISIMVQFMMSVGKDVDGRQYRSPLGDFFERSVA